VAASTRLRATRTTDKQNPRMVKRRNSPHKPFDRNAPRNVDIDCTPAMVKPMLATDRHKIIKAKLL
jgi:hypothetical protein